MTLSLLLLAALAPADSRIVVQSELPTLRRTQSLRELCIRAPLVVLATPDQAHSPTRFTVTEVLRGKALKRGDRIAPLGISEREVCTFDAPDPESKKPRPRFITVTLLFLEPGDRDGTYRLMDEGIRLGTEDGRVLAPPKGLFRVEGTPLEVSDGVDWAELLRHVRGDVLAVDRLHAARHMVRPRQRVRALTDWVERRRGDFARAPSLQPGDLAPSGWYELASEVFAWIFADATVDEAWAAVRLYAALNRGEIPRIESPVFASEEGRELLMKKAADVKLLIGDRRRAMQVLALPSTLNKLDEKGRAAIAERLRPALLDRDEELKMQAIRSLVALRTEADGKSPKLDRPLLTSLISGYRAAPPGVVRDELAVALCKLAPAEQYRELTTNPAGVCVRMTEFTHDGDEVHFLLDLRTAGALIHDQPTLVMEKMGNFGFVAETKRVPLVVQHPPGPWSSGIGDTALAVRIDLSQVIPAPAQQPGRAQKPTPSPYRFRIEGAIGQGKDRRTWRSEPKTLSVLPGGRMLMDGMDNTMRFR